MTKIDIKTVEYTVEYTSEYNDKTGNTVFPQIHILGRTYGGTKVHLIYNDQDSYFYIPSDEFNQDILDKDEVIDFQKGYESIYGEHMIKISTRIPPDVPRLRDSYRHYEGDIPFGLRFMIDNDIRDGIRIDRNIDLSKDGPIHIENFEPINTSIDSRYCFCDIEVDDVRGFPDASDADEKVICITAYDSYLERYDVFVFHPDLPDISTDRGKVRMWDNEQDMMEGFVEYLKITEPDFLAGWNFEDFDAKYLYNRLKTLSEEDEDFDLEADEIAPLEDAKVKGWGVQYKGLEVFDMLEGYKMMEFTELDSYSLEDVAQEEIGEGKVKDERTFREQWENDTQQLVDYNITDVELLVKLEAAEGIIKFYEEMSDFVGWTASNVIRSANSVDSYLLRKAYGEYVLPSKETAKDKTEDFEGATVFPPSEGLKDNVIVLDLACFSGDTEVATPHGVKNITDIDIGDEVYTLNPDTHKCEITEVTDTHEYHNKYRELAHIQCSSCDFKVTENHNMYLGNLNYISKDNMNPEDYELTEVRNIPSITTRYGFASHKAINKDNNNKAKSGSDELFDLGKSLDNPEKYMVSIYTQSDLSNFRGSMPQEVTDNLEWSVGSSKQIDSNDKHSKYFVPLDLFNKYRENILEESNKVFLKNVKGSSEIPLTYDNSNWCEFIGWFVTEGSTSGSNRLKIHQSKSNPEYRKQIETLIDELDIPYSIDSHGINISNKILVDWFESKCGTKSQEKTIPDIVFESSISCIKKTFEAAIKGDGSIDEHGLKKFWTSSVNLKEDIVRAGIECGYKPQISQRNRTGTDEYYVSFKKGGSFTIQRSGEVEEHDGNVYCITTKENNIILAGRNGKFQWIGQSLYPHTIKTINAGPETKNKDGHFKAPNGVRFQKEPRSIVAGMIDELIEKRDKKKSQRDKYSPNSKKYEILDRQQTAIKVITNTIYGVMGSDTSRVGDKETGAAVTSAARGVIGYTKEIAESKGFKAIYGDTDSVMIELGDEYTKDECLEIGHKLEEVINEAYDKFAKEELNASEHWFQVEFEKLYRRFLQAGKKKRYAGHITWKEGKETDYIDITGFEYKRSDYCERAKKIQKKVFDLILNGHSLNEISEYVRDELEKIRNQEYDLDELGIPGSYGGPPSTYDAPTMHSRGGKYTNDYLHEDITPGDRPKGMYVKKIESDEEGETVYPWPSRWDSDPNSGLQPFICWMNPKMIPDEIVFDWDKLIKKQIQGPIDRLLKGTEWSWAEVKSGQRQRGLQEMNNDSQDGEATLVKIKEEKEEDTSDFDREDMEDWEIEEKKAKQMLRETQEMLEDYEQEEDIDDEEVIEASVKEPESGVQSLDLYL